MTRATCTTASSAATATWCGGGEFASATQQARVSHADLVIGCLVDLATGLMTFTANGKEINTFFQVEPNTKLFPAVFALPTSQNVIQFELGKLKNIMPISAAMFSSERKNPEPQCPPRLVIQHLTPVTWSRMPNEFLAVDTTRLSERQGWMVECNEPLVMMALHIPEENRCIDIMELSERSDLLRFQWHTLKLYCAVCALGNNRVAHALCSHVDQAQLLFAIESPELPGPLRAGYYDLLLAMHLDAAQRARASMSAEFIIPMTEATKSITLFPDGGRAPGPPGVGPSACLRPQPHFAEPCFILAAGGGRAPLAPSIPLGALGARAIRMLEEAVAGGGPHARDPVGGSVEFQLVPVLKLVSALLAVGALGDGDVRRILRMIEPRVFGEPRRDPPGDGEGEEEEEARKKAIEAGEMEEEEEEEEEEKEEEEEEEEGLEEGLLQMKLPESVKLQMCNLLQYFCERELQHRVEAIVAFSERHVERLQRDQRRRYGQLMRALTMSAAETARRTREFRSPPQEQINMLLQYKAGAEEEECPVPEDIRDELLDFHNDLLAHCGIELADEEEEEAEETTLRQRLLGLVQKVVGLRGTAAQEEPPPEEPPVPSTLQELISQTMVHWAQESFIQSPELVRAMFSLLHRQYDGLGELVRALPKAYTISALSVPDTVALLECLGQIRSLLIVQMGPEEENLMIQSIGNIMNNKVFYQHPQPDAGAGDARDRHAGHGQRPGGRRVQGDSLPQDGDQLLPASSATSAASAARTSAPCSTTWATCWRTAASAWVSRRPPVTPPSHPPVTSCHLLSPPRHPPAAPALPATGVPHRDGSPPVLCVPHLGPWGSLSPPCHPLHLLSPPCHLPSPRLSPPCHPCPACHPASP
ncbi:ryanodine receptor 1-like [Rissa tridactyla]|uniref:ryanodine receptor 1-like n=1 Tax=Rissa tridactyla TaxID=75485 RepID=UPI0023BAB564|nr:ryanodine receptor 1-like [Rissa tridactyla]